MAKQQDENQARLVWPKQNIAGEEYLAVVFLCRPDSSKVAVMQAYGSNGKVPI